MQTAYSISVLVLAKNEEITISNIIEECIKILPQVSKDYEILINDDASTGKTTSTLDSLSKKFTSIKVFHQKKPLGIAGGFEFLYKKANKNLVFTLAGDGQYTIKDLLNMKYI